MCPVIILHDYIMPVVCVIYTLLYNINKGKEIKHKIIKKSHDNNVIFENI